MLPERVQKTTVSCLACMGGKRTLQPPLAGYKAAMNSNDRVTELLEQMLEELRGIREALEGQGEYDEDEEEYEEDEDEEVEEE